MPKRLAVSIESGLNSLSGEPLFSQLYRQHIDFLLIFKIQEGPNELDAISCDWSSALIDVKGGQCQRICSLATGAYTCRSHILKRKISISSGRFLESTFFIVSETP